jgi:hypothetical protein
MNLSTTQHQTDWQLLWNELGQIRQYLNQQIACVHNTAIAPLDSTAPSSAPASLDRLCHTLSLSEFERQVLLLCVAMELDKTVATLCAEAQGDERKPYPTFDLALALFPHPHWSALTPNSPLRRWRLIELGTGQTLTLSPLRVDEWVLHYLTGTANSDERLTAMIQPVAPHADLVPSHQQLATQIATLWRQHPTDCPLMQLSGQDGSKHAIAAAACEQLGWQLYVLSALVLPTQTADLHSLKVLWEREAVLRSAVLLIDCDAIEMTTSSRQDALLHLIEQLQCPLLMTNRDRWQGSGRSLINFEVHPPTVDEQQMLWRQALGSLATDLNGQVELLATEFKLNAATIQAICTDVVGQIDPEPIADVTERRDRLSQALRQTCRVHSRPRLDDLTQRIEAIATWNDLVLPDKEVQVLQAIAAHVSYRKQVYDTWGFRSSSSRGLGISALFAGASGTGKTMSAEVLAHQLQLDLYRIDLSAVVSKYIGETEKNLRRIFDAAEASTVILLFDEADALFGKRSDVKDSHDRYANMEVSYLLQRMEAYQGLAILTTNLKDSLDTAFLRRIRFVVKFPFPDASQRAQIWQRIFPSQTPTQDLEVQKLAKLNVAGGNIRNIALNATFLAAQANEPVQMHHLRSAAYSEYTKLERTLTDAEVRGWE